MHTMDSPGILKSKQGKERWIKMAASKSKLNGFPLDLDHQIFQDIYRDMLDSFTGSAFHIGGDEVNFNCWNTTQEITDYMDKKQLVIPNIETLCADLSSSCKWSSEESKIDVIMRLEVFSVKLKLISCFSHFVNPSSLSNDHMTQVK